MKLHWNAAKKYYNQIKNCGPDASVRGGHVHFKLHSSQFLSKFKTVWTGDSPDAYAAANVFVWP